MCLIFNMEKPYCSIKYCMGKFQMNFFLKDKLPDSLFSERVNQQRRVTRES